jgi:O-antigen ligase
MEGTSIRSQAISTYFRRIDWGAVWTWLLCFGLVAYLGIEGGGYDPLVHDQVGIAVWWVLLAGVVIGALPRVRPEAVGWTALALIAGLAAWTALSLDWTESSGRTAIELGRHATYVGVFALALLSRASGDRERLVAAVASAIVVVALVGLLSRLHPAWFPDAGETGRILEDSERLSYPLNYWNGMAALIAIGLPLVLHLATGARTILTRALAAAALPALALTAFFTLSRGGIATAIVVLAVFLAFASDRLPKLLTLLTAGAGGAVLIAATLQRDALEEGLLNAAAREQGDDLLLLVVVVCLVVGLLQAALSYALLNEMRPGWTEVPRRHSLYALGASALVALVALAAFDVPGRASNGWAEFKEGGGPGSGTGRLGSVAGQNRYQFWSSAVRQNSTGPLAGTGAGTFELWWTRDGDRGETVRDAHSLYMQTLGELGIVGLVLLVAFLLSILVGGAMATVRAGPELRSPLAAALAGTVAFCLSAAIDWTWQIPAIPVAMLLLGSTLVAPLPSGGPAPLRVPLRAGAAVLAIGAIVAIAIPLASTSLLRQSESDARAGELDDALRAARSAANVQPGAAAPRLQEALVLEQMGELGPAAGAAGEATEREPTNWKNWLVRSRIEAERGRAVAAVRHFREAESLNPNASIFSR